MTGFSGDALYRLDSNLYCLQCPMCGCEDTTFGAASGLEIEVWPAMVIPFRGKCGGYWDMCFGDEGGVAFVFHRIVHDCRLKKIDYHEYIQSESWRQKATEAKERAGWRCQICNAHKDEVTLDAHHRTYERLGNELPEDITVLCRICHTIYEETKKSKAAKNGQVKK